MSYALLAKKEAAPAARAKASSKAASSGLRIGDPDDALEREADRVADEVMAGGRMRSGWSLARMTIETRSQLNSTAPRDHSGKSMRKANKVAPLKRPIDQQNASNTNFSLLRMPIRRPRLAIGTIDNSPGHPIADQLPEAPGDFVVSARTPRIQRLTGQLTGSPITTAPAAVERVLASPGSPLPATLRHDMEQGFGHDFSQVQVHSNYAAQQSAKELDAQAYTVGRDIVFGEGRFNASTREGQRLIAHELTHVVQQEGMGISTPTVMRAGRTFGGFLANIFQFWDYSTETLVAYLKRLDQENRIQRDDDSDDMARQIVKEWKKDKSKYDLTPKLKILLVREMLDGVVSGADQEGIIDLLEGSVNSDLINMFKTSPNRLTYDEIHARFDSQRRHLELFNTRVLKKLGEFKSPDPADAKSLESRLDDVEKQSGFGFQDLFVSFHLAPGTLYKSFKVDLKATDYGVDVTVGLTRSHLEIRFAPALLIDVIWPLKNALLNGFDFIFAGLQLKLDIDGMQVVSEGAQEGVHEFLKGLVAGTRFEDPTYDPVKDPHLVSKLLDPEVKGDLERVKYNFQKKSELEKKDEGDSKIAENISGFGIILDLVDKKGRPAPSAGWDVVIAPEHNSDYGFQRAAQRRI